MVKEVRASHILVDSKGKANELVQKIRGGGDFAMLAKKHSSCPSGAKGGDLGYFTRGKMVKQFDDAAFALEKGQVSDPVETQFGFHIIKVTDKR